MEWLRKSVRYQMIRSITTTDAFYAIVQRHNSAATSRCSQTSLGGDNKLAVVMLSNSHPVQCTEAIQATPKSCQYILDEMYKSRNLERFGKGQRYITVATPLTLRAREFF